MSNPKVLTAVPALVSGRPTRVTVTFDQLILPASGYLDPLVYQIDGGLLVEGVIDNPGDPGKSVLLTTTEQVGGRAYTLTVSSALQANAPPYEYMDTGASTVGFTGLAADGEYVVTDLVARTHPDGRSVELFWTNPEGIVPENTKITRRLRNWPLVETDASDVVYSGVALDPTNAAPTEPKYVDTGLLPVEFYYYTVMVKAPGGGITTYAIGADSRVMGLSGRGAVELASDAFLKKQVIPPNYFSQDAAPPGNGEMQRYLTLFTGFLNLLRSKTESLSLLSDWERAPFSHVTYLSRMMGFEPEGGEYDLDTPRRVLLQLWELWQRKGALPGIAQAVRALVQWETELVEFGVSEDGSGIRSFGTDDTALAPQESHTVAPTVATWGGILDPARTWADALWRGGRLLDGMGNWFDIEDNTLGTTVSFTALQSVGPWRTALTAPAIVGARQIVVTNTTGFRVGQRLQLYNSATGNAQIIDITHINTATKTLSFWNPLRFAMASGSYVLWDMRKPEASYSGTVAVGIAGEFSVTVAAGATVWPVGRWTGYVVKDAVGGFHTCTSSDAAKLYFAGDPYVWTATDTVEIARSFSAGIAQLYYKIENGYHPRLFNPTFDFTLVGTRLDPAFYLYGGSAGGGTFGACDLGIYVLGDVFGNPVPAVASRVTSVAGAVITDSSASFTANEWAGYYILPNQNYTRTFKIASNTGSTITAESDLSAFATADQPYVILTERNAARYRRLLARIRTFMGKCLNPKVLFL